MIPADMPGQRELPMISAVLSWWSALPFCTTPSGVSRRALVDGRLKGRQRANRGFALQTSSHSEKGQCKRTQQKHTPLSCHLASASLIV